MLENITQSSNITDALPLKTTSDSMRFLGLINGEYLGLYRLHYLISCLLIF